MSLVLAFLALELGRKYLLSASEFIIEDDPDPINDCTYVRKEIINA